MSIDIKKIKSNSPAASAFVNEDLLKSLIEHIKLDGLPHPIQVMYDPESIDEHPQAQELQLPPQRLDLRPPEIELLDQQSEPALFTVVDDDLLFRAINQINRESDSREFELVPCDLIEPDKVMVAGASQKLVMTWDARWNDRISELNVPHLAEKEGRYVLRLEPRSLLGAMYFLSHAVRVPLEHQMNGLVVSHYRRTWEPL